MNIPRKALNLIKNKVQPGKVIILLGARRVGKTFLLNQYLKDITEKYIFWNGEDFAVHDLLKRRSVQNYKNILGDAKLLIIDEAQKIPDAGMILKLIVDSFENLKIVVTGSSAFDNLSQRLVYGNLPELANIENQKDKAEYLREIISSYLLKNILAFENLRNSSKLFDLLKLIAFQAGNEVSVQELGKQLAMSKNTVERYLDILSKVFVVYRLNGFSRNLRKEIVKNSKWNFYDNGIRNAIIANFNSITTRDDLGVLWENYLMSERIKHLSYSGVICNRYFWRTYDKQEIDLIEEREGKLFAYEFKWKADKAVVPAAWESAYPDASYEVITSQNFMDWLKI